MIFGADIIAGFPTETDEMFENSLKIVKECDITYLHVFPFSPKKGTPAAKMPQTPKQMIKERAAALRDLGQQQLQNYLKSRVGRVERILVESNNKGRTDHFTPVKLLTPHSEGTIIESLIRSHEKAGLVAEGLRND